MTKYKKYFDDMIAQNKELFESFRETHDNYVKSPKDWKDKFNSEGEKVLEVVKHYENLLCHHSENVGYGKFSTNLADKFWVEVRLHFPRIDFVGIK